MERDHPWQRIIMLENEYPRHPDWNKGKKWDEHIFFTNHFFTSFKRNNRFRTLHGARYEKVLVRIAVSMSHDPVSQIGMATIIKSWFFFSFFYKASLKREGDKIWHGRHTRRRKVWPSPSYVLALRFGFLVGLPTNEHSTLYSAVFPPIAILFSRKKAPMSTKAWQIGNLMPPFLSLLGAFLGAKKKYLWERRNSRCDIRKRAQTAINQSKPTK